MSSEEQHLLSKALRQSTPRSTDAWTLPDVLLQSVPVRLRTIAILALGINAVAWGLVNLIEGQLLDEFKSIEQWPGPVIIMASSGLVLMALWRDLSPRLLARIGLVYEFTVSVGIALGTYWGAFAGVEASAITGDRLGFSWVALWILGYTASVPAPPRLALVALAASSATPAAVFAVNASLGLAPVLAPEQFLFVLVLPYALCAGVAYFTARTIQRLGRDVKRAREIGSYRLQALIGKGGMGEVWRAEHSLLARPAAIKLIQPDLLVRDADDRGRAVARFEREAQITALLESPHTVQVYDYGVSRDGTLYYVMELLDGIDLQSLVERHGPMRPERAVYLLVQACASLAEAHRRGLIHRDVKPANIFLSRRAFQHDFVKVLDFGLAKARTAVTGGSAELVTRAETIVGTPHYLAPEMAIDPDNADGRADLYALGCVAFWLLTARPVFTKSSAVAIVLAHATETPVMPSTCCESDVPAALDRIILDCLAKDPGARPRSAEALRARLQDVPLSQRWSSERAAQWWETRKAAAHREGSP